MIHKVHKTGCADKPVWVKIDQIGQESKHNLKRVYVGVGLANRLTWWQKCGREWRDSGPVAQLDRAGDS